MKARRIGLGGGNRKWSEKRHREKSAAIGDLEIKKWASPIKSGDLESRREKPLIS